MEARIKEEYEGIKAGDDVLVRKSLGVWERGTFEAYVTTGECEMVSGNFEVYHETFLISEGGAFDECKPLEGNWWLEGTDAFSVGDIWKPTKSRRYYRVDFLPNEGRFCILDSKWQSDKVDWDYYVAGMAFGELKEAKLACHMLNVTLRQIKTMMTEIKYLPF